MRVDRRGGDLALSWRRVFLRRPVPDYSFADTKPDCATPVGSGSSVAEVAGEYEEAVGRDGDVSRVRQAVNGRAVGVDAPGVALDGWVGEVVVEVTVEDFVPVAWLREAERVTVVIEGGFVQACDYHDVAANLRNPPLECEYPVARVGRIDGDRVAAERRMPAPQPDQIAREPVEVTHMTVGAVEPVPPDQAVGAVGVVRPQLVLKELLAHEYHRYPGGSQEEPGCDAGPAARVPGPRIASVGQSRDARVPVVA